MWVLEEAASVGARTGAAGKGGTQDGYNGSTYALGM